jgi:hypothetical protein
MGDRLATRSPLTSGPEGLRATLGLLEAGMRIDPPSSVAWAIGRMRAATAAADPAEEPPAL